MASASGSVDGVVTDTSAGAGGDVTASAGFSVSEAGGTTTLTAGSSDGADGTAQRQRAACVA